MGNRQLRNFLQVLGREVLKQRPELWILLHGCYNSIHLFCGQVLFWTLQLAHMGLNRLALRQPQFVSQVHLVKVVAIQHQHAEPRGPRGRARRGMHRAIRRAGCPRLSGRFHRGVPGLLRYQRCLPEVVPGLQHSNEFLVFVQDMGLALLDHVEGLGGIALPEENFTWLEPITVKFGGQQGQLAAFQAPEDRHAAEPGHPIGEAICLSDVCLVAQDPQDLLEALGVAGSGKLFLQHLLNGT
mmetsp:Transcript_45441/g.98924  ORF Transcript_45441/g.98924 Transcript_45441/m.98924 type:complete len:241 (-) Transcript_45441:323-1045(-)